MATIFQTLKKGIIRNKLKTQGKNSTFREQCLQVVLNKKPALVEPCVKTRLCFVSSNFDFEPRVSEDGALPTLRHLYLLKYGIFLPAWTIDYMEGPQVKHRPPGEDY